MRIASSFVALSLFAFVASAPTLAADQAPEKAGQADMKAAMQGEMERQLLVGMVALKDYCKQAEPDKSADFDASWEKNTADVPAELKTYSATPEFATAVAQKSGPNCRVSVGKMCDGEIVGIDVMA